MKFELDTTDGRARRGRLVFDRGVVETPCFMPVGTYGTVKGMKPEPDQRRPDFPRPGKVDGDSVRSWFGYRHDL